MSVPTERPATGYVARPCDPRPGPGGQEPLRQLLGLDARSYGLAKIRASQNDSAATARTAAATDPAA